MSFIKPTKKLQSPLNRTGRLRKNRKTPEAPNPKPSDKNLYRPVLQTPDLSQSFHPTPKVYKSKKPSKPLNKIGKKTQINLDANEVLKEKFKKLGIESCELTHKNCWKKNALTFAHDAKRRKLTPEDLKDINHVALICTPGHMEIEVLPAEEMKKIIEEIVKKRNIWQK